MCYRKQAMKSESNVTVIVKGNENTVNTIGGSISLKVGPTTKKTDDKNEKIKLVHAILLVIPPLITLITFLIKDRPQPPVSTPEPTILTTGPIPTSISPTDTSEPTRTSTQTYIPTPIMSPTITPDYTLEKYIIGVFEQDPTNCVKVDGHGEVYKNLDRNEEIITGLQRIGFNAIEVPLSSKYEDLLKFDVLYMPNGWSCSGAFYNGSLKEKIRKFLDGTGKGLLIGDPKPDSYYSLDLFPNFTTDFFEMTLQDIKGQSMPNIRNETLTMHFQKMLEEEVYPWAETMLTISEKDSLAKYRFIYVLCHENPFHCSLVSSHDPINAFAGSHVPRFIIMPGSEYSVSEEHAISPELMKKLILWLAHVPVN